MIANNFCVGGLFSFFLSVTPALAQSITFVGNSLTQHGKSAKIGWDGDWGMAASAKERDYRNQLLAKLRASSGRTFDFQVISSVQWERAAFQSSSDATRLIPSIKPDQDIVVVQIGDNLNLKEANLTEFVSKYGQLLREVRENLKNRGALICVGKWWPNASIDNSIRSSCEAVNGRFVDVAQVSRQDWAAARTERPVKHAGVGAHPGDRAMAEIAEHIYRAIEESAQHLVRKP